MKKNRMMKRWKKPGTYIGILGAGVSIWFFVRLVKFGMLEPVWLLIAGALLTGVNVLFLFLIFQGKQKKVMRHTGIILSLFLSVALAIGALGMQIVDGILGDMTYSGSVKRDISLVVMKDSPLKSEKDLNEDTVVGIQKTMAEESTDYMLSELKKRTKKEVKTQEFENLNAQIEGLYDGQADVVILNEAYRSLITEERENFNSDTRVLFSVSYEEKQNNISRKIDVSSDPFLVMISGIDTYGTIDTVSRSDVNILAAVNPKTAKILLVSIPRDYYVPIIAGNQSMAGQNGSMDKLTHSGLFGTECTVRTVENLFGEKINYYVKVNFSSVVDIVDAIGGITVESDYAFDNFQVGSNVCNGEQALAFARNRYAFEEGDRQRGKNQMKVIQAIVEKISGFSMDYDYGKLIQTVQGSVEMNFSDQEVKQLVQLEMTKRPAWNVETISVNGTDGNDYSYFYGSNLYVMYPDQNSVAEAKSKIQDILREGEE